MIGFIRILIVDFVQNLASDLKYHPFQRSVTLTSPSRSSLPPPSLTSHSPCCFNIHVIMQVKYANFLSSPLLLFFIPFLFPPPP